MSKHSIVSTPSQSFLHGTLALTKFNDQAFMPSLLENLVEKSLEGVLCFERNLSHSIHQAIQKIDALLSIQIAEILHHPDFSRLEGVWRGLHYLVKNTETTAQLHIKMMPYKKSEALNDFNNASEFDQSTLYKKIYEYEFGSPGGKPYSLLVGDYEFSHHSEDIQLLRQFAQVAAAAFCPFISAAAPALLGLSAWRELNRPRDLSRLTDGAEHIAWQSFRDSDDARFVYLSLPRALARLPYGQESAPVRSFQCEELAHLEAKTQHYCWMNAAYLLATQMNRAFAKHGWCISIRGTEGGGRVENLPLYTFKDQNGGYDYQCPTEVSITDRREAELSHLGFLPLCHYKNTDYAVFFGAESTQKARLYDKTEATENARISARLPYIMATSRFAHYLKIMSRDKIGAFMEVDEAEDWLNRWILNYVNGNQQSKQELKAKYPLAEAQIKVSEIPGKPGCYQAIAWLRPWLQMEELTTSMRLVAKIPKVGS